MRRFFLLVSIMTATAANPAIAQMFPRHADICVDGIVSKEKLAKAFVRLQPDWYDLYVKTLESASDRRAIWSAMFTSDNFCKDNPACLAPDPDAKPSKDAPPKINAVAANRSLEHLRIAFRNALIDEAERGKSYAIAKIPPGASYFVGNDRQSAIQCLANEPPIAAKPPSIAMPNQLRLRANSDDLKIPSNDDAFKGVAPATVSYTRDGTTTKTNTAKLQAALGYAIDLREIFANAEGVSYFDGELVPYLSAVQSVSKVAGKPATFADTNVVALGAQLNTQLALDQLPGINHVLSAKPQYLWNTKNRSEIASLRAIYEPWAYSTPIPINAPFRRPFIGDTWWQVLFDLRTDVGEYTQAGIDQIAAVTHTSFIRSGSRFGFAIATLQDGPHIVLNVTETMMYGFKGSVRRLSFFDSNLSYYFDSTDRFAVTLRYTKGQNVDTAEWAQTATVGFSAKF
jgi:hypothetical protein